MIWANLVHLSFNMWSDRPLSEGEMRDYYSPYSQLPVDDSMWNDILHQMQAAGFNMIIIDLGDGVHYRSHPEIVTEGAWSPERLRQEIAKARDMGLEPIPKLNFSTCHDYWLKEYAYCVSTPRYYTVCKDLIAECIELFDNPRFFHLGMDEETADNQRFYRHAMMRQYDLWWHDLNLLIESVENGESRAWVWSDYLWHKEEDFLQNMPRSVLQSNWYYSETFGEDEVPVKGYKILEAHGYGQVPTGSNWRGQQKNFEMTVEYARRHIAQERLLGFMQTPWRPTLEKFRDVHEDAISQVARVIEKTIMEE